MAGRAEDRHLAAARGLTFAVARRGRPAVRLVLADRETGLTELVVTVDDPQGLLAAR